MAYQYPLRSYGDRGRGKIHAPHPESSLRPLCRKTPIDWRGPRYQPVFENDRVTCRVCLRLQGKEAPGPKRLGERAALGKALVELGLQRDRDFRIRTNLMPECETGGLRMVESTSVTIYDRDPAQKVLDNAQQLIEKLWTNDYGRHHWTIWQTHTCKDGHRWVEITTQWRGDHFAEVTGYTEVASCQDLPDRNLYWGEESSAAPQAEPATKEA